MSFDLDICAQKQPDPECYSSDASMQSRVYQVIQEELQPGNLSSIYLESVQIITLSPLLQHLGG